MSEARGAKIALVTGASRGIGRATALELARRGYRVFAMARSEADLTALSDEAAVEAREIVPVVSDVADDGSRSAGVEAIMAATDGHGVDVLVNNAGFGQLGPVEEIPIESIRRQFEVNLFGLVALTQAFLPGMRRRRQGHIVNMSSAAGRVVTPFMGIYSASKFALEAVSDALRRELVPWGVHVVLIEPGPIRTEFGRVGASELPRTADGPYAPYLRRHQRVRSGRYLLFERSAESVARLVARVIESRHPRPRYTITIPARLGTIAHRFAPDLLLDWVFRLAFGLRRG